MKNKIDFLKVFAGGLLASFISGAIIPAATLALDGFHESIGSFVGSMVGVALFTTIFSIPAVFISTLVVVPFLRDLKSKTLKFILATAVGLFFSSYGLMFWPVMLSAVLMAAGYFTLKINEPTDDQQSSG